MSWKSYFYPQDVVHLSSRFNRDIRVVEYAGKLKLLVNGSPQSGPYIKSLWKKVLAPLCIHKQLRNTTVLVLGVGGGTVIQMLQVLAPDSHIVAVDIDKKMIDICKKYFHIRETKHLTIIRSDALTYVKSLPKRNKFGTVIIDLFIGRDIPAFVLSDQFLTNIAGLVSQSGLLIVNYLREGGYKEKSDVLLDKLLKIFHSVIEKKLFLNRFFICTNR